ncbi:hypothetical protein GCM10025867_25590 [Frondihabitans sucicola]|uniref:FHA domain-containing protein n=1 Tax=Frondihabitans sucicola TaxID=1268041 RepID=A0ABN6Y3K9_9MICO|nr:FHA domain-containing protein [Frondihabitans sucicola]BDZ50318.1 hypothetical protein GCM10025867_25590 [Frondihabitans sucicola]
MSGALLGSLSCARCAQILPADELFCTTCGARQLPSASGGALSQTGGLLAGVVQAAAPRRRFAVVIDTAALLVGAALLAASVIEVDSLGTLILLAVVGAAAVAVVQLVALRRSGRTLGLRLLDLRHVDNLTALPPGMVATVTSSIARWRPRSSLTADLRRGRDPLTPAHAPVALAEQRLATGVNPSVAERPASPTTGNEVESSPGQSGVGPRRRRHGARAASAAEVSGPTYVSARLVFDSGDEVVIRHPLLVGRNPETDARGTAVHALPDLSRSLSRTHALLDWRDGLLWVTDLNTTNGSAIVDADGGVRPLVPGLRTAASVGWRVELGERSLEIHPGEQA